MGVALKQVDHTTANLQQEVGDDVDLVLVVAMQTLAVLGEGQALLKEHER